MARKWSNANLPGALHFLTGNLVHRTPAFMQEASCLAFLEVCGSLVNDWPSKLIAYVLMPDHVHLIVNGGGMMIQKSFRGQLRSWLEDFPKEV